MKFEADYTSFRLLPRLIKLLFTFHIHYQYFTKTTLESDSKLYEGKFIVKVHQQADGLQNREVEIASPPKARAAARNDMIGSYLFTDPLYSTSADGGFDNKLVACLFES